MEKRARRGEPRRVQRACIPLRGLLCLFNGAPTNVKHTSHTNASPHNSASRDRRNDTRASTGAVAQGRLWVHRGEGAKRASDPSERGRVGGAQLADGGRGVTTVAVDQRAGHVAAGAGVPVPRAAARDAARGVRDVDDDAAVRGRQPAGRGDGGRDERRDGRGARGHARRAGGRAGVLPVPAVLPEHRERAPGKAGRVRGGRGVLQIRDRRGRGDQAARWVVLYGRLWEAVAEGGGGRGDQAVCETRVQLED